MPTMCKAAAAWPSCGGELPVVPLTSPGVTAGAAPQGQGRMRLDPPPPGLIGRRGKTRLRSKIHPKQSISQLRGRDTSLAAS